MNEIFEKIKQEIDASKHYILLDKNQNVIVEGSNLNSIYKIYNESKGDNIYMRVTNNTLK